MYTIVFFSGGKPSLHTTLSACPSVRWLDSIARCASIFTPYILVVYSFENVLLLSNNECIYYIHIIHILWIPIKIVINYFKELLGWISWLVRTFSSSPLVGAVPRVPRKSSVPSTLFEGGKSYLEEENNIWIGNEEWGAFLMR